MITTIDETRKRKGLLTWLVAASILIIAITGNLRIPATAAPALNQPLLPQATRIVSLGENGMSELSEATNGIARVVGDVWLSDHELLHPVRGVLCRYDTASRTDTALTVLQKQVSDSSAPDAYFDASPISKWLLWGKSSGGPSLYAAPADGSRREQWPSNGGLSQPFWCADGHHWLQFLFDSLATQNPAAGWRFSHVRVQDVNSPRQTSRLVVPPGLRRLEVLVAVSEHEVVARVPNTVKVSPSTVSLKNLPADFSDPISATTEATMLRQKQVITVWDLHRPRPLRRFVVSLPGVAQGLAVSSRGDRVAWLLNNTHGQGFAASLWVSHLDGSRLHQIGVVQCSNTDSVGWPTEVRWLPGEKRISFVCKNALWTVPVK